MIVKQEDPKPQSYTSLKLRLTIITDGSEKCRALALSCFLISPLKVDEGGWGPGRREAADDADDHR